jgi:NAD(P)-dependent dehydrogenase (short-subunit alcohol dehydrogenase family)
MAKLHLGNARMPGRSAMHPCAPACQKQIAFGRVPCFSFSKKSLILSGMKHVLVTGASTGIGFAVAQAFLEKGYHVYGSVRKQADADRLQKELGAQFVPLVFDVTDHAAIAVAAKRLEAEIGKEGLACLVNNAGIAVSGPMMLLPMDHFREQFEVNVFGLLAVTQAFLPLLGAKENPGHAPGRILMVSSVGGKLSAPFLGAYTSSKHAVEGLSASLRMELQLYGIDVIIIGPGAIRTPIWDKPSANELGIFANTAFAPMMTKFQKYFVKGGQNGLHADHLAREMVKVFEKRKPKIRYAFVPEKFKNWTMPRLLPPRMLDRIIGKSTGLLAKK